MMSLPQTGGFGFFWIIAGVVLMVKSFVQRHPIKSSLIIVLAIFCSQLSGFAFPGSHWDSFGNEDGLVWRGASEQNLLFVKNFGLRFGEEHVYGEKPWNKKLSFYFGPVGRIDFSKPAINSVLSFGFESRVVVNANFFLTPYASYWFSWNFKRLVGSFWSTISGDCNSLGLVVFLEQGIHTMNIGEDAKLIPQITFRGTYSFLKSCPRDRNLEIGLGPKIKKGLFDGFIHLTWNSGRRNTLELKTQVSWWIGWDLQNFLRLRKETCPQSN